MCPVESPTGADRTSVAGLAEPSCGPGFTRPSAAQIAGLTPSELRRWENLLLYNAGLDLGATLGFADVVALAVLSTTARCLGAAADDYAVGLARLLEALRERADLERLDSYAALVGHDSAHLATKYDIEQCAAADILIIPLRPILAALRDLVFS